ncbi:MAG: prepilin-type N-terminal cleavage/methylation domain-containing protein [Patescibacteria group bacterium]
MKIRTSYKGFTIVELLIVIVIISILAAVTVTAFSGVQQRAKGATTASQASKMHKYLSLYVTQNGAEQLKSILPVGGSPVTYCLGTGYIDVVEGGAVGCYVNTAGQSVVSYSALDTALQTVGATSMASYPRLTINPDPQDPPLEQSAPTLTYVSSSPTTLVDGRPDVFGYISYLIPGANADCGNRPMLVYQGLSGGNTLYTKASNAKNSASSTLGGGYTTCQLYFHPDAI